MRLKDFNKPLTEGKGNGIMKRVTFHLTNVKKVKEKVKDNFKTKLFNTISIVCSSNEVEKVKQHYNKKHQVNKVNVSNCYKNRYYV